MPAVEMRNITKRFHGFVANDRINISVEHGEIHAILGENGAGKSTLMNVLFGLYQPDEGQIYIDGEPVHIHGPNDANELGIGMVHQHFMLVDDFTVTENIILGMEPSRRGAIRQSHAQGVVNELSDRYGLQVDPLALIRDISVGMQQRVEILKTLYRGAKILIFDEPTAVLTPQEIDELIQIMRNLKAEGRTIILITHKLKEIMSIADRVTIIRRGQVVDTVSVADTSETQLAEMMVGRQVLLNVEKEDVEKGDVVLQVKDLVVQNRAGLPVVDHLSLEIASGEILGIAGVDGNGQAELVEALAGLRSATGTVLFKGHDITRWSPRQRAEMGIAHVPDDRQKRGLILDFTVGENTALNTYMEPQYGRFGMLDYGIVHDRAKELAEEFDIRTQSVYTKTRSLSGGNQQKIIIGREVSRDPDLLIVSQPTRGLDIGAIEFIHKRILEQRSKGKAVLLVSFELDELLNLSDRIAVIFRGKISGIVNPKETTDRQLGLLMAGGETKERGSAV